MKSDRKVKRKSEEQQKLIDSANRKLKLWKRMLHGDTQALIEITIDRGMASKEDFNV